MGLRNVFVAAWLSVSSTILAAAASASPDLPCAGLAPALSEAPGFIRRGDVYIGFDVDSPGVAETGANGINDLGQIAGLYVDTAYHARYCSRQGNYQLINVSLTDGGVAAVATAASKINNRGQIVGRYNPTEPDPDLPGTSGFLLDGHKITTIAVASNIGAETAAEDINDAGMVVGSYVLANNDSQRGFLWRNGKFVELDINVPDAGPGGTAPFGINNNGDIVGSYLDVDGRRNGFLRSPSGGWTIRPAPDGADDLVLTEINDNGHLTGLAVNYTTLATDGFVLPSITGEPPPVAFPGAPITLPAGLNNDGVVVGVYLPVIPEPEAQGQASAETWNAVIPRNMAKFRTRRL